VAELLLPGSSESWCAQLENAIDQEFDIAIIQENQVSTIFGGSRSRNAAPCMKRTWHASATLIQHLDQNYTGHGVKFDDDERMTWP